MNFLLSLLLAGTMTLSGTGAVNTAPDVNQDSSSTQTAELVVPETITVRVTGVDRCYKGVPYHIEEMNFKDYVKGVLPAEWGNNWSEESLKAGAVAVKMYAWSLIDAGGKWSDADVYDCNWDQVYKPEWRTRATDNAVEKTWSLALVTTNPGKLVRTYYDDWYGTCLSRGETNCMGQWNSKKRAEEGETFDEILATYYKDTELVDTIEGYTPQVVEEKVPTDNEYVVQSGDSLSTIAYKVYGETSPELWMGIYESNLDILRSPDLINVGMILTIPAQ